MLVTQLMTPDVITVAPETPIDEVARLMVSQGVSGLPVVDPVSGELVGMITELEMVERQAKVDMPAYSTFLDATFVIEEEDFEQRLARVLAVTAGELMERTVYSIREDATIEDVATLMFERKVNPVPVVSLNDELLGIVSRSDIIRLMARDFTEPGGDEPTDERVDDAAPGPAATMPADMAPIAAPSAGERIVVTSDDLADRPAGPAGSGTEH